MKDRFYRMGFTLLGAVCLLLAGWTASSCSDDFELDKTKPSFLKESIYDELKANGSFNYEVRLIDDLNYADVLSKTGSKTLFVANDDAFEHFFRTTTWKDGTGAPVRSYEQLSYAQKSLLLRGSMLDNAYVMEMLANTSGGGKNLCLRQGTSSAAIDSIPFWYWYELPEFKYEPDVDESSDSPNLINLWEYYRGSKRPLGIYMAVDRTSPMMTHFLEGQMNEKKILHSDVAFVLGLPEGEWKESSENGENRSYIYNRRVVEPDVTCLNGYYHVLDSVLLTPPSMAEVIRTNGSTNLFSEMIDRFSAPYFDALLTSQLGTGDSVFTKRYISNNSMIDSRYSPSGQITLDPKGRSLRDFPTLSYDPAWNEYAVSSSTVKENDMAAMFVPDDASITEYFLHGGGVTLMERYAKRPNTEENLSYNLAQIPLDVVQKLINNLMKNSFNETVPSKYLTIMNDAQDQMFPADTYADEAAYRNLFEKVLLASNGVVYVMNRVIAPADFSSVIAPVLLNRNTRVVNSVLRADDDFIQGTTYDNAPLKQYFSTYLKAMQSRFSFFVPTDDGLAKYGYVDPISIANGNPNNYRYWKLNYSEQGVSKGSRQLKIDAVAYKYDPTVGPQDSDNPSGNNVRSRANQSLVEGYGTAKRELMIEMLNQHILIHDNDDTQGVFTNQKYFTSRGGAPIIVTKRTDASAKGVGMQIAGGYQDDLSKDEYPANDHVATVTDSYDMTREQNGYGNGMTYFIDRPIQPTMKSVYSVLRSRDEFSDFFRLCDPDAFSEAMLKEAGFADSIEGKKNYSELWAMEQNKFRIFTRLAPYYPGRNDYLVRFFNNYRYTIYIPTNDAVQKAIAAGLPTWASISEFISNNKVDGKLTDDGKAKAQAMITYLINFLKYHFQDGAYYVDNVSNTLKGQTSCIHHDEHLGTDAYLYIDMEQTPNAISLTDEAGGKHAVIAPYNILVRDMSFNVDPATNWVNARYVRSSSYATIHQIDGVLNFSTLEGGKYGAEWSSAARAKRFTAKYRLRN
ncbi:MAG: hypothetical protein IJ722_03995 [Alloprevotella sp.]|nr:hypothetical protein [Alloprevotella sp.]